MANNDQGTAPPADPASAIASLGVMLGGILSAARTLVKLATQLEPLNDTVARCRDLSTKQLDALGTRTDKLTAAFGRYDDTSKQMVRSFDEAARAHNQAAKERTELSANLHALCAEVREVVALLRRSTQATDAMPALVAQQVAEALARAGIDSSARGLH